MALTVAAFASVSVIGHCAAASDATTTAVNEATQDARSLDYNTVVERARLAALKAMEQVPADVPAARSALMSVHEQALHANARERESYAMWLAFLDELDTEPPPLFPHYVRQLGERGIPWAPSATFEMQREYYAIHLVSSAGRAQEAESRHEALLRRTLENVSLDETPSHREQMQTLLELGTHATFRRDRWSSYADEVVAALGPNNSLSFSALRTAAFGLRLAEDYPAALAIARRAYETAQRATGDSAQRWRMSTSSELGVTLLAMGDLQGAQPLLEFARDAAMVLHPSSVPSRAWVWLATGHLKVKQGEYEAAIADYARANEEIDRRATPGETFPVTWQNEKQINRLWIAFAHACAGRIEAALAIYDEVMSKPALWQVQDTWIHSTYPTFASLLIKRNRLEDTERLLKFARQSAEQTSGEESGVYADIHRVAAELSLAQNQLAQAREALASAVTVGLGGREPFGHAESWFAVATQLESRQKPDGAILAYKLGAQVLEGARYAVLQRSNDTLIEQPAVAFDAPLRRLMLLLVDRGRLIEAEAILAQFWLEEQFQFVRRSTKRSGRTSTATTMMETLDLLFARSGLPLLGEESERVRELSALERIARDNMTRIKAVLGAQHSWPRSTIGSRMPQDLLTTRDTLKQSLGDLVDRIATLTSPDESNASKARNLRSPSSRLERGLNAHVRILVAETGLVGWVTTPRATRKVTLPTAHRNLMRDIAAFRDALRKPASNIRPPAQRLWHNLIEPFWRTTPAMRTGMVRFEVDGPLRYIPFAALHDGQHYLAERITVVQGEPIAVGGNAQPSRPSPRGDRPNGRLIALSASHPAANHLDSLPTADVEVATIVREWPNQSAGQARAVFDARVADVQDAIARKPDVLHLAMHFRMIPGNETASRLLLADGETLSVGDLHLLDFQGIRLVVLSACETALDINLGREISGATRSIIDAGADAVMGTLWPISDGSSSVWMRHFYRAMRREQTGDVRRAVASTQRFFLSGRAGVSAWKHPFYWAAYTLSGAAR